MHLYVCSLQDTREKFLGEQPMCRVENYGLFGSKMLNVNSKNLKNTNRAGVRNYCVIVAGKPVT